MELGLVLITLVTIISHGSRGMVEDSASPDEVSDGFARCLRYSRSELLRLRRHNPPLSRAVQRTKELQIFRYRGTRAGKNNRNRPAFRESYRTSGRDGWGRDEEEHSHIGSSSSTRDDHCSLNVPFLLMNARSICNKREELELILEQSQPTFVGITETWLRHEVPETDFSFQSYNVHRTDRKSKGGGVCLMAGAEWQTIQLNCIQHHPKGIECNMVKARRRCMPRHTSGIIFYTIYVVPALNRVEWSLIQEHISSNLDHLGQKYCEAKIVVWGDFNNFPFFPIAQTHLLKQWVNFHTRANATLDQIWTNLTVSRIEQGPPLGNSDHVMICGDFKVDWMPHPKGKHEQTIAYRQRTDEAINRCGLHLGGTDWRFVTEATSVDSAYDRLKGYIIDVNDNFFVKKSRTRKPQWKKWMTDEISGLMKQRDRAYKAGNSIELTSLSKEIKKLINKAKSDFYRMRVASLRVSDSRSWYGFVRHLGGRSPPNQRKFEGDIDIEVINDYFIGMGRPQGQQTLDIQFAFQSQQMEDIMKLEEFEVAEMLRKINLRISQPLFDIPNFLLKQYHAELAKPFASLLNKMLSETVIPKGCQIVEILPLPKSKSPKVPKDFRPITRQPTLLKMLDQFLASILSVAITNKIDQRQFGGRPGLSCTHYLIGLVDFLHRAVENKEFACLQTIDLTSAYPSVSHEKMITKLIDINLKPQVFNMIARFLTSLQQVVRPSGTELTSSPRQITRGILQGTSLAPRLFIIFLNDIPPNEAQWHYVDDITPASRDEDLQATIEKAQGNLNEIQEWVKNNELRINTEKTYAMLIQTGHPKVDLSTINLQVNGQLIQFKNELKILGIWIQDNLKWDSHVRHLITKANSNVYFFRQLCANVSMPAHLTQVFNTFIRPSLEFACPIWAGALTRTQSNKIESVQRKLSSCITRKWSKTYQQRLDDLGQSTLEDRRSELSLKFARKLISVERFRDLFPQEQGSVSGINTRSARNLQTVRFKTEQMRRSPIPTLTRLLNSQGLESANK